MTIVVYLPLLLLNAPAATEPTDVLPIEQRALAARRALKNGRVELAVVRSDPTGKAQLRQQYSITFEDASLRLDHETSHVSDDGQSGRTLSGQHVRTDELLIRNTPTLDPSGERPVVEVRDRNLKGADARIGRHLDDNPIFFDPRLLGMAISPVGRLHGKPLEILVGRPDRERPTTQIESLDGHDCSRVDYVRADGVTVTMWIDPDRGHSLVKAELKAAYGTKQILDRIETTPEEFGEEKVWYPRKVVYQRHSDGELLFEEIAMVKHAEFNRGVEASSFGLEGMDIPAGTRVRETPTPPDGPRMWNGKEIVPVKPEPVSMLVAALSRERIMLVAFGIAALGAMFIALYLRERSRKVG